LTGDGQFIELEVPSAVDASFVGTYNTVLNGINNDGNMVGTFSSTVLGFGSFVYIVAMKPCVPFESE
jgi:hypothetical protein